MSKCEQIIVIGFPPVNLNRATLEYRRATLENMAELSTLRRRDAWELGRIKSVLSLTQGPEHVYALPFQIPPLPLYELAAPWVLLAALTLLVMTSEGHDAPGLWALRGALVLLAGWGAYSLPDSHPAHVSK